MSEIKSNSEISNPAISKFCLHCNKFYGNPETDYLCS